MPMEIGKRVENGRVESMRVERGCRWPYALFATCRRSYEADSTRGVLRSALQPIRVALFAAKRSLVPLTRSLAVALLVTNINKLRDDGDGKLRRRLGAELETEDRKSVV